MRRRRWRGGDPDADAAGVDGAEHAAGSVESDAVAIRQERSVSALTKCAASFNSPKVVVTGNPMRFNVEASPLRSSTSQLQILVLGGSSGAHRLNVGVVKAFRNLRKSVINLHLVHQTGEADEELVRSAYARSGSRRRWCRLSTTWRRRCSCRSGYRALRRDDRYRNCSCRACGHFRAVSLPPRSPAGAQRARARTARRGNNSRDDDQLGENLAATLRELIADPSRLVRMGVRARTDAHPDAARHDRENLFRAWPGARRALSELTPMVF